MKKIKTIDLFAGCGGLCEGFEQEGHYQTMACVEWEKAPCNNLSKHLREKWKYKNSNQIVLRFDIQRTDALFSGWKDDPEYGTSCGLDQIIKSSVDIIIGGPPCQGFSLTGPRNFYDKRNKLYLAAFDFL